MNKSSKIIYFKRKKMEIKYKKVLKKRKYIVLFLGIPVMMSSIYMIDNSIIRYNYYSKGIEYKPYYETYKDKILNESDENEYLDLKKYYNFKYDFKEYIDERTKKIIEEQEKRILFMK